MLNNRKKYLLVKVIEAEPMTLGEFYKKQGYKYARNKNSDE